MALLLDTRFVTRTEHPRDAVVATAYLSFRLSDCQSAYGAVPGRAAIMNKFMDFYNCIWQYVDRAWELPGISLPTLQLGRNGFIVILQILAKREEENKNRVALFAGHDVRRSHKWGMIRALRAYVIKTEWQALQYSQTTHGIWNLK